MKYSKSVNIVVLLILSLGFLSSCLPEEPPIPHRLELNFNVDQVGNTLEHNGDTISISKVKFLMDGFILTTDSDASLESNLNNLIFGYREQNDGRDEQVFAGNLGFEDFKTFTGIEIFVEPAESGEGLIDSDLSVGGEFYSFVLEGNYNGSSFAYRSKTNFDKLMDFQTVTIDANEETLAIRISSAVSEFIIDSQTSEILDPTDSNNSAKIDSLFNVSLGVEATSRASIF